jgi:rRNA maturation endonuclease Nob1
MLENAGIVCFTRNEISSGLAGKIALSESTPELWIQNDNDLAEALEIKRIWKGSAPVAGSSWVCPACGETSEPQFSSCWNCGALNQDGPEIYLPTETVPKPDTEPVLPTESTEVTEEIDEGMRIRCVSCDKIIKIGVKFCPFCDYTQPYVPAA